MISLVWMPRNFKNEEESSCLEPEVLGYPLELLIVDSLN